MCLGVQNTFPRKLIERFFFHGVSFSKKGIFRGNDGDEFFC